MSVIDDQIKTLQKKKKKIQFLNHILKSTKEYRDKDLDADASKEVIESLAKFVEDQIKLIEADQVDVIKLESTFSEKELNALRAIATKVLHKGTQTGRQSGNVKNPNMPPQIQANGELDTNAKMSFALENRHLAGKKVTVANDKNLNITGTVTGLDAPNIIVHTDTGPIIQVPIGNVSLL